MLLKEAPLWVHSTGVTEAVFDCVQGAFDLVCIGVGLMLGAGVFVTTGTVAVEHTG